MTLSGENLYLGWDAEICANCQRCYEYAWFVEKTASEYAELFRDEIEKELEELYPDSETRFQAVTQELLLLSYNTAQSIMSPALAEETLYEIKADIKGKDATELINIWEHFFKDFVFSCPIYLKTKNAGR